MHLLSADRLHLALGFIDSLQSVTCVLPDEVVCCITLQIPHDILFTLLRDAIGLFPFVLQDYAMLGGCLVGSALNTGDHARIGKTLIILYLSNNRCLLSSRFVLINDHGEVDQILGLDYTVAELDDELQVFHNFRELKQIFLSDTCGDIQDVELKILQLLKNLKNLVLLWLDYIVLVIVTLHINELDFLDRNRLARNYIIVTHANSRVTKKIRSTHLLF